MRDFPAQYSLKDEDVLYFSHIPKTAGMTFRTIVEDHFHCDEICPATLNAQVAKIPQAELQKYRLFRGHLGFINLPELLPGKNVVNVTVLREPIARVISHYDYIRRMPKDPHYPAVKDMTLAEFAQRLTAGKVGKNIQTYHVAKAFKFSLEDLSPAETLDLARKSLDTFAFVGLVERFQDSLFLLSYIFGWKPILNSRKENAAKVKKPHSEIPADTLEVIKQNTLLDQDLYAYSKEIFETRFDAMVQDLLSRYGDAQDSAETVDDDRLVTLLERHYEQRYADLHLPESRTFLYDFSYPLRGIGWQRREYPPEGGTPYRWMGPTTVATLDLPKGTASVEDALLEFNVIMTQATAPDILESLTVAVNHQPIPLKTLHSDRSEGVCYFQGVVPKAVLQSDRPLTEVKFQVDRVVALKELNPHISDTRLVGLVINCVQILPSELEAENSTALALFHDPTWQSTLDFVTTHIQPQDRVVAPLGFKAKLTNNIFDYNAFLDGKECQWLILHKGSATQVSAILLQLFSRGLTPVFANEVFIVYSTHKRLAEVNYASRHVRPVYIDRVKKNVEKTAKSLYHTYLKSKSPSEQT